MASNSSTTGGLSPPSMLLLENSAHSQSSNIIAAWVVMIVLAAFTVSLRFYTRRFILTVLALEDWLIFVAMVLSIGACIGFVRQTQVALGKHAWTVTPEDMIKWQMENWYTFLFYTMSLAFTKVSILILYMRILVHGWMRIANWVVLGIVMACNIWVFIGTFLSCIPIDASWNPMVPGKCLGLASALGNSVLHVITDFLIFALPLPAILGIKLPRKQKIGLLVVFSLGFFVCLISIIRIIIIGGLDFSDMTYEFSTVAYWGAVEVNLAIICACLTILKPLLVQLFPRLLNSTVRSGTSFSRASATRPQGIKMSDNTTPPKQEGETIEGEADLEMEADGGGRRDFTRLDDASTQDMSSKEDARDSGQYRRQDTSPRGSYIVTPPSKAHCILGLH